MIKNNFCQLWLTVGSKSEADKITKLLLDKHLTACARQIPISSNFLWKGKIDHSDEILLQMESSLELFDKVEAEVKKIHSYKTFILEATPVAHISKRAEKWLQQELKNG